jgi:hypothetical protein
MRHKGCATSLRVTKDHHTVFLDVAHSSICGSEIQQYIIALHLAYSSKL